VKLRAEDFRQHYADLSDGELLSLNRAELTEIARECYDQEMAQRGLKPVPEAEAEESESADEAGPVTVGAFNFADEANLARGILGSAKIPCYVESDYPGSREFPGRGAPGAYQVVVSPEHAARARQLLAERMPDGNDAEPAEPWDGKIEHRFAEVNGIRMHYAEAGSGPLVLLLHGFPELWYSWRHQLPALAAEGYRAVAPDLRGYGQTDRPEAVEEYDIFRLVGDIAGLVNALEGAPATLVGHDWGSWLASHAALLRPDLFGAVALLSVPFVPRRAVNQTQWEAQTYPGKMFYQAALRSSAAEKILGAHVRATLLGAFWSLSGDAKPEERWKPVREPDAPPAQPELRSDLPPWLTGEDLDFYDREYWRTGFTGGLNYYRNMDRNWELTPFLDGARLNHPSLFIAGQSDPVLECFREELADLAANAPYLWKAAPIAGAGHWIQQERPTEVNRLLIEFLRRIEAGERAQ
jgi:pimeloyl-ACP methyl ester carboxylesterase